MGNSKSLNIVSAFLVTSLCSLLWIAQANATPLTFGDQIVKPLTWPKNSTLNVYIQKDPKEKGREQIVKEGVERWKTVMAARNVTVNVTIGDPPAGTENVVRYSWEAEDFKFDNLPKLQLGNNDGIGICGFSKTRLLIGKAFLHKDLPADTDAQKNYLRNLSEHEFVHVIGLADDSDGQVTNHEQSDTARTLNDQDKKEINLLYGTANTAGENKPQGMGSKIGGGAASGFYEYQFVFNPGNIITDPNDPEHVSLIDLGIDPSVVTGVDLPAGWLSLISTGVPSPSDPFFDKYMVDGGVDPSVWDPSNPMSYIAFRTSREKAFSDGLSAGFDPGLTTENLSLNFIVHTKPGVVDGLVSVWAGGELRQLEGPVLVPEPSSFILLILGLAAFLKRKL